MMRASLYAGWIQGFRFWGDDRPWQDRKTKDHSFRNLLAHHGFYFELLTDRQTTVFWAYTLSITVDTRTIPCLKHYSKVQSVEIYEGWAGGGPFESAHHE